VVKHSIFASSAESRESNISVIVPTWNEELWLTDLLKHLIGRPEILEIIVADNASTDRTVEVSQEMGAKVVVGGTPSQGRNVGAGIARGEILLFTDADVFVDDAIIDEIVGYFTSPSVHLVHFYLKV
jgi:glycosyltransferase involved in cell wall biosynthesis